MFILKYPALLEYEHYAGDLSVAIIPVVYLE